MRVLVTGCNGFIARHLIRRLVKENYEVVGVDDYSNSDPDNDWESEFEFHQQDIRTLSPGHSLFNGVDTIFHLAAKARVQPSFDNPMRYYDTNVTGTLNLLEAAKQWKVRKFVFSSSSSVYGGTHIGFIKVGHKENDILEPASPYALSKVHGEELCLWYKKAYNMDCIILRYFNVYGDNQPSSGQYPQMLPYFMHLYKKGEPFPIYGTGDQRRDFTYVKDVVEANILAMLSDTMLDTVYNKGVFNIGSAVNHSVNEICDMIDPVHPRKYLPARIEPFATLADNTCAKLVLGWHPNTTLKQWIKNQIL
jgi:UDP-glucose 4-epimerase